jgi:hypothetical protein
MNEPRTATVLGGRYRLEERLAAGGMGTVWSATDEVLNRRVAVKILNEGLADDERFIERFRREAKAAALAAPADAAVTTPIRPSRRPDTKLLVAAAVLVAVVHLGVFLFRSSGSDQPKGVVIKQFPSPGTEVHVGDPAILVVSGGPGGGNQTSPPPPPPAKDHGKGKDKGKGHGQDKHGD